MEKYRKLSVFVGHREPDFRMWSGFRFADELCGEVRCKPIIQGFPYNDGNLLGEYGSLFSLRRSLEESSRDYDQIIVSQYRRFVTSVPLGESSTNKFWTRVISNDEAGRIKNMEIFDPKQGSIELISNAIQVPGGIIRNYAESHHLRDILRFTAAQIDAQNFSADEMMEFLHFPILIPAPSCGSFQFKNFMATHRKLEAAASAFYSNGFVPHKDPYQGRVLGFLIERLHSFLLIKNVLSSGQDLANSMGVGITIADQLHIEDGLYPAKP